MSKLRFLICYMCTREREKEKRKPLKKKNHARGMGISRRSNETFLPVARGIVSRSCTLTVHEQTSRRGMKGKTCVILVRHRSPYTQYFSYSSIASSGSFRDSQFDCPFCFQLSSREQPPAATGEQERFYRRSVRNCFTP